MYPSYCDVGSGQHLTFQSHFSSFSLRVYLGRSETRSLWKALNHFLFCHFICLDYLRVIYITDDSRTGDCFPVKVYIPGKGGNWVITWANLGEYQRWTESPVEVKEIGVSLLDIVINVFKVEDVGMDRREREWRVRFLICSH